MDNNTNKPLFNLIVRTHQRPNLFREAIENILSQNYNNLFVVVIADDGQSEQYARAALDDGLVDDVVRVRPAEIKSPFSFESLKAKGLVRPSDRNRAFYNAYFNEVVPKIEDGWILFFDDDGRFASENSLKNLVKKLGDPDKLVVARAQIGNDRIVPNNDYFGKLPFSRGQIAGGAVCVHSKHKNLVVWDGFKGGDWRLAVRLAEKLEVEWYNTILKKTDCDGFGRTENELKLNKGQNRKHA